MPHAKTCRRRLGFCDLDSSYEKAVGKLERRGSLPMVSRSLEDNMDATSGTFKLSSIQNFFSKKTLKGTLKRTKSATKLDRKRTAPGALDGSESENRLVSTLRRSMSLSRLTRRRRPKIGEMGVDTNTPVRNLINSRLRTSRSHESLLHPLSSMHSVDLSAPDIQIKPLHSSILGQDHCFQVSTSNGTKYYSCRTAEERQKWIECLRKTVHPNQEQSRRTDNSFQLWILEAKNVTSKKRYFCEVCLDRTLYARTSSKSKGEILFWGENFDFNNLPAIETVTVNIYREADKKKKKDKNQLIGYVNIPVDELNNRQLVEKWYTASSGTVGRAAKENKSDLPLVRLKARYQTVQILPMDTYQEFIQYLSTDYMCLVEVLEPVISVKAKEEIAMSMVRIMQRLGKADHFLPDIVMGEIDKLDNEHLTFRGNSIATKSIEAYMKLVGEKYLQDTLGEFVRSMLESTDDCEPDPTKVTNNNVLQRHQASLVMYCEMAWVKIINSACYFPRELKDVFAQFRDRCVNRKREDVSDNLISASIFLRFLCPSIMSPSLFGLTQEFPQDKAARNLTLIAKTIQNLANFTKFGGKEEYMVFMNDFVEREWGTMKQFLTKISNQEKAPELMEYDGYIDLGKELSIMHSLLVESLEKLNEATEIKLARLRTILATVSEALKNPEPTPKKPALNNVQIYDNLMNINNGRQVHTEMHTQENIIHTAVPSSPYTNQAGNRRPVAPDLNSTDDYVLFHDFKENSRRFDVSSRTNVTAERSVVDQSWNDILHAAELVNGEYVDLISYMDDVVGEEKRGRATTDQNMKGSQTSISQLSTVASSGYQSFGYSQSSSPVDSLVPNDGDNGKSPPLAQPLSFANPMYHHKHAQSTPKCSTPRRDSSASSLSSMDEKDSISSRQLVTKQTTGKPYTPQQVRASTQRVMVSSSSSESIATPPRDRRQVRKPPMESPSHYARVNPSPKVEKSIQNGQSALECQPASFNDLALQSLILSQSHDSSLMGRKRYELRRTATDTSISYRQPPSAKEQPIVPSSMSMQTMPTSTSPDDSLSAKSPDSPRGVTSPSRRPSLPQTGVHMGIRSVQRKINDQDKTKIEYEHELNHLRQQLFEAERRLREAEEQLSGHAEHDQQVAQEWQKKLEESEEKLRQQQAEKDQQMKNIIQRLISVEEELRREHAEMQKLVTQKQKIVEAQERRIQSLDSANTRLMTALSQLKERYQGVGKNGVISPWNHQGQVCAV
ncbi:ras GTPase-activating protein nGAP isoform X4 [Lingula anatina]|uniref:Ras GTPase-activating protein nGAP isoform X4 n=1 Tax=Lingula anatina TaxID=7574 RepID=A0A1S3JSL5_LINAN|nr:ras GTPase-activating protein nGAP isoform X4 [Lingula anatina]|eukprot:XP_013413034.1 ras GTPase-activating protein nGAP isoform X4 [Lingula anatina]